MGFLMHVPNWSLLGVGVEHSMIRSIAEEWRLLISSHASETECHAFLKKNANLFLVDGQRSYLAISKLKLGSGLELDFAVPYEEHSRGLFWELIEIKGPGDSPFNSKGNPGEALTAASQQIRDWKRWIKDSRSEAKKVFYLWSVRTEREPNFRYTVIIGTRKNSAKWIDKRNDYANENRISVRSFDYLTERLERRHFMKKVYLGSGMFDQEHPECARELANPFVQAFTDSSWKRLLQEPDVAGPHFFARSCRQIFRHWECNESLIEQLCAEEARRAD